MGIWKISESSTADLGGADRICSICPVLPPEEVSLRDFFADYTFDCYYMNYITEEAVASETRIVYEATASSFGIMSFTNRG